MKNKTVLIILSVSVLLFLYIFLVDKQLMSTDEKKARAENVFVTLRADQVNKIELETPKGKIVLESGSAVPGETPTWRITSPKSLRADGTEVQALISAMDFLIYNREVKENPSDKKFGFQTPRVKGTAWFKGNHITFAIGADAPDGDGVYVSVESEKNRFFVVSADFLSAMNKSINDLRDKHLLDLDTAEIASLSVQNPAEKWSATRDLTTGNWQVNSGQHNVAGVKSELKQLAAEAANLKVVKFISDDAKDTKKYGLDVDGPTITLEDADKKQTTIKLGADCGDSAVFAQIEGHPTVDCVDKKFQSLLVRPVTRYFEKRLLPVAPEDITRLRLEKGEDKIELSREDDQWHVTGLTDDETSQTAISELFENLKTERAESVRFATPGGTGSAGSDTGEAVLASPTVPATGASPLFAAILETNDGETISLSFFQDPQNATGVLLKRDDSDGWLPFSAEVARLLTPYPLRFRTKQMTQCHPADAVTVDITGGKAPQKLKKSDTDWLITAPVDAAADAATVKKLLTLSCETPVVAYPVTDSDPFSTANLFATVTVAFAEHTHDGDAEDNTRTGKSTIEIGAHDSDDTRFARIKEKPDILFTVSDEYTAFLHRPIAARNLLAIQSDIINQVVFSSPDQTFHARKENGRWVSDDCRLDSDALNRVVIDFGAVKAIAPYDFASKVQNATTEIQFGSDQSTPPAILRFGDSVPENDGVIAARDGLAISFILPARLIRDMAQVCQTPAPAPRVH